MQNFTELSERIAKWCEENLELHIFYYYNYISLVGIRLVNEGC